MYKNSENVHSIVLINKSNRNHSQDNTPSLKRPYPNQLPQR